MDRTSDFLSRYGLVFSALIVAASVLAFFYLRPQNLVPEGCGFEGFDCREISLGQGSKVLAFVLESRLGSGIMLDSVSVSGTDNENVSCREEFDDGWGIFASGRHVDSRGYASVSAHCTGLPASLVGNSIRLSVSLSWHPDNESAAFSRSSSGELFAVVDP